MAMPIIAGIMMGAGASAMMKPPSPPQMPAEPMMIEADTEAAKEQQRKRSQASQGRGSTIKTGQPGTSLGEVGRGAQTLLGY